MIFRRRYRPLRPKARISSALAPSASQSVSSPRSGRAMRPLKSSAQAGFSFETSGARPKYVRVAATGTGKRSAAATARAIPTPTAPSGLESERSSRAPGRGSRRATEGDVVAAAAIDPRELSIPGSARLSKAKRELDVEARDAWSSFEAIASGLGALVRFGHLDMAMRSRPGRRQRAGGLVWVWASS
jgi:hypothetical protein